MSYFLQIIFFNYVFLLLMYFHKLVFQLFIFFNYVFLLLMYFHELFFTNYFSLLDPSFIFLFFLPINSRRTGRSGAFRRHPLSQKTKTSICRHTYDCYRHYKHHRAQEHTPQQQFRPFRYSFYTVNDPLVRYRL